MNKNKQPLKWLDLLVALGITSTSEAARHCKTLNTDPSNQEAVNYIVEKYGEEQARPIINAVSNWPRSREFFDSRTGKYVGEKK